MAITNLFGKGSIFYWTLDTSDFAKAILPSALADGKKALKRGFSHINSSVFYVAKAENLNNS